MDGGNPTGRIHQIETFGSVDGPGVRFVIFMQGCPLRCAFCHNPETWDFSGGEEADALSLIERALRYKDYWSEEGGITVSGGEPLAQIDFLLALFSEAKRHGISTCIDTAGSPFTRGEPFFSKFRALMEVTDLLLVDIKHIDPAEHKKLTGADNGHILDLFRYLDEIRKPVWIRHVLVPGISDDDEYLRRMAAFIRTLGNVERVDVLPYHTLGVAKYKDLGIPYPLEGVSPPTAERIANARRIMGAALENIQ